MNNIEHIVREGLCISCGVCAGNCPKECIELVKVDLEYVPQINLKQCIYCGICQKVCPSEHWSVPVPGTSFTDELIGYYQALIAAKAKDSEILKNATSGGIITQLIAALLEDSIYDSAFLVEGHDYSRILNTHRFVKGSNLLQTSKSRYVTVSHKETIRYMIRHRNEKIIIVGTACAVQGIINTIHLHKLNRENYFIIGLFCDKTMHYGVISYFQNHPINHGRTLQSFYFRSKEVDGWPGGVLIVYSDGSYEKLTNIARISVKDYFLPERCLYCLDKLNKDADMAVGDDYSPDNEDLEGVSTILIRTDRAVNIWNRYSSLFQFHSDTRENLETGQFLFNKEKNYYFGILKGIYPPAPVTQEMKKAYRESLRKRKLGKTTNTLFAVVSGDIRRLRWKARLHHGVLRFWVELKKLLILLRRNDNASTKIL